MAVELIIGPPIQGPNGMDRVAAEKALLRHPSFPENADYKIEALEGKWIAAFTSKVAAPFPPSGDDEESGPPKGPDGPPDAGADDGPPSDDGDSDGPPSDDGGEGDGPPHKEKGGEKGGLHIVEQKLDMLMQALGIDPSMAGGDPSMVPGDDGGMGGGPPGGPGGPGMPGPGGPGMNGPPGHGGPPPPEKIEHERALKPGEVPPGGTPLGAPSFASVKEQHPWGHTIGVVPHFRVAENIGDQDIVEVESELQTLAAAGGFKVGNFTPMHDENGDRYVSAVISTPVE